MSDRVYRAAWTPAQAFELLHAETGAAFDPRCVEALATVLGVPAQAPGWVADAGRGRSASPRGAYSRC